MGPLANGDAELMASGEASPLAHAVLRERTREAHAAAEDTDVMRRLVGGELDDAGYTSLLAVQWRLFREWEGEHRAWLDGPVSDTGWRYESRTDRLEADMAHVGARPARDIFSRDAGSRAPAPGYGLNPCRAQGALLQTGDAEAASWGMLYVIEGSALGGRILSRRLRERFPQRPHDFYAIGENTPPWRRFQSILDKVLDGDDAIEAAIHGAQRMFARFHSTLKDPARHV